MARRRLGRRDLLAGDRPRQSAGRAAAGRTRRGSRPAAAPPRPPPRRPGSSPRCVAASRRTARKAPGRTIRHWRSCAPGRVQPLAPLFGGDQRGAVGQPRPGLAGEVEVGLGQDLSRHGHVGRDRRARRTGCRRRTAPASPASPRTARRRSCARRAAAGPAADGRSARRGAARQSAAACRPLRSICATAVLLRRANPGRHPNRSAPRSRASADRGARPRRISANGASARSR